MNGYFCIRQDEILAVVVVEADNRRLTLDGNARYQHRLGTNLPQLVYQHASLLVRHANLVVLESRQITSLRVVRVNQVGHRNHLLHARYRGRRNAIVQLPLIAHDGVNKRDGAVVGLFATIVGHHLRLSLRGDESRGDGTKREAEFLPYGKHADDVVGGVEQVKLPVIQRIRYERRGQVVSGNAHVRQHGKHGSRGHLPISSHVVYQQNLTVVYVIPHVLTPLIVLFVYWVSHCPFCFLDVRSYFICKVTKSY